MYRYDGFSVFVPNYVKNPKIIVEGDFIKNNKGIAFHEDSNGRAVIEFETDSYRKIVEIELEHGWLFIRISEFDTSDYNNIFNVTVTAEFYIHDWGGLLAFSRWMDRYGLNIYWSEASTPLLAKQKALAKDERHFFYKSPEVA